MKALLVKESLDESIKLGGHVYDVIKIGKKRIKVGKDGILGDNGENIYWDTIEMLLKKYR